MSHISVILAVGVLVTNFEYVVVVLREILAKYQPETVQKNLVYDQPVTQIFYFLISESIESSTQSTEHYATPPKFVLVE